MKTNMINLCKRLVILFSGILISSGISAQKDTTRTINLDEIVVTGTRAWVNRNNVPLTVSVVTNEKIENSSESALLPVLSEQVPGLFVTERGITGFGGLLS
jgi:iron complex outermembrane receptor protein